MAANTTIRENELVNAAVAWLKERLPSTWSVEPSSQGTMAAGQGRPNGTIVINAQNGLATLAVEAKRSLAPRDIAGLFGSVGRTLRALSPNVPILVIAPWLSARTRELLAAEGISYVDLTGNARV